MSIQIKQTSNAERQTSNAEPRALKNSLTIDQRLTIIVVLWVGLSPVALAQNNQDELKQRVLAQAKSVSPDDYAFTRTVRSEQTSNGKTEKKVTVEKFDPTKPLDGRWTLISVDGAPPSTDALREFKTDSSKRRVPGYYRLAGYFGTPATTSADSRGRTVFRFTTLPKDTVRVMDTDVAQNTTAEAAVADANGTPFVEQVRFTVRPMRLKLVMKLDGFESTARYCIGPEGKPLLMEQTSDMAGSGMGNEGKVHSVTTYSDYRTFGKQR